MYTKSDETYLQFLQKDDKIIQVFHKDIWLILGEMISWGIVVILWTVSYYQANTFDAFGLQDSFSFTIYGVIMVIIWCITMYQLFDWYNDVLIISEKGITSLDWTPLKTSSIFSEFSGIEGIELQEPHWWYSVIKTTDVLLHKIGTDIHISRLSGGQEAVALVQKRIQENTYTMSEPYTEKEKDMNIYIDTNANTYSLKKKGQNQSNHYLEDVQNQEGTIDLRKMKNQ